MYGFKGKGIVYSGRPRRTVLFVIVALVLSALLLGLFIFSAKYTKVKRMAGAKEAEAVAFEKLRTEYLLKKSLLERLRRKAYGAESRSIVAICETLGKEAGVGQRIVSLKPLGEKVQSGYVESAAELRLESVKLDELVNLLYMIENHRLMLVIKDFRLKSRFDNPDLIDVTMQLARLRKSR